MSAELAVALNSLAGALGLDSLTFTTDGVGVRLVATKGEHSTTIERLSFRVALDDVTAWAAVTQ